jgi:hypothetical protein
VLEFVDWDGDGDLLAGGYITGCVFLYENALSPRGSPPQLTARGPLLVDGAPLNVGHWCAAPCAADMDDDGDLDLLSGHTPMRTQETKAHIRYFENVGSPAGGLPASDRLSHQALARLRANQRESGRWFTPSQAWHTQHLISNAGTAYSVLAFDACGEIALPRTVKLDKIP